MLRWVKEKRAGFFSSGALFVIPLLVSFSLAEADTVDIPLPQFRGEFSAKPTPRDLPSNRSIPIGLKLAGHIVPEEEAEQPVLRQLRFVFARGVVFSPVDDDKGDVAIGVARLRDQSGQLLDAQLRGTILQASERQLRFQVRFSDTTSGSSTTFLQLRRRAVGSDLEVLWKLPRYLVQDGYRVSSFSLSLTKIVKGAKGPTSYLKARCPKTRRLEVIASAVIESQPSQESEIFATHLTPC